MTSDSIFWFIVGYVTATILYWITEYVIMKLKGD